MKSFVGIDPGLSGAVAHYRPDTDMLVIHDTPTFTLTRNGKVKRDIDLPHFARIVDSACLDHNTHVLIEQVGAMPGQGVTSVFAFGKAYGIALGVAAATFCPVETVTPQVWKRALGVPKDKDGARARASALMPQHAHFWPLKKNDGAAEAAMIAYYGAMMARKNGLLGNPG